MAEPQPKDAGEKASAVVPAEPHRRPFAEFVVQTNRGITHARLTKALHDLIAAVTDTGKGGELVLKVKVAPLKKGATGQLEVSEQVTTKLPQTDGVALRRCKVCLGPIDDDGTDRTQCHRCRTVLAIASGAPAPAPEVVNEAGGTCTRRPGCPWTGGGECGDCLGDSRDDDGNLRDGAGELVEDEDGAPLPAEHVHEPRVVLEGRVWHAVCDACGTTWHRTLCTAPGCGAYVTGVLVEVAGRFARLVSRTGVEDYQDGTGSRRPIPGDGAHRPGKLVRDEVHARNNARKATGNAKWSGLLIEGAVEAHAADDPADLRHALLDTAATAVAWIHALDHRGAPDDDTPVAVVSSEPRSQLLELLDEVTVAHTAHMLARLDVGKARRAGLNEALEEALAKAEQASYAVTAAELRARAAIVRHLPPGATA